MLVESMGRNGFRVISASPNMKVGMNSLKYFSVGKTFRH